VTLSLLFREAAMQLALLGEQQALKLILEQMQPEQLT
jgi:hypothetical protein